MAIFDRFRKKPLANAVTLTQEELQKEGMRFNALQRTLSRISNLTFGVSPDGKRNYNQLYGYGDSLGYSDYYGMYKRGGIANTVVSKIAKSCWRDIPKITVDGEAILEEEMEVLANLGLFKALERADILNRIGSFSVLLIGLPDDLKLADPLGAASKNQPEDIYFNPYSEEGTTIAEWDNDPASPRYGQPILYNVQTSNFGNKTKELATQARKVHYTRVVHLAEGRLDSSLEGCSALEAPWNALIDKDKARGGSGEAYFRNARQKFALEAVDDKKLEGDLSTLKNEVEAFTNNQQDFMRLKNMTANVLQPAMASPRDTFDIAVEEVAGVTGIPIRVLTGKGGGNLAGSEDKASWNALVNDRQNSECTEYLTQALRIFEEAGFFELPKNHVIEWPVQPVLNETESANAIDKKASALQKITDSIIAMGEDADINEVLAAAQFEDVTIKTTELPDED